jgi:conjugal transfer/type IV secretion protein DotA/TraY
VNPSILKQWRRSLGALVSAAALSRVPGLSRLSALALVAALGLLFAPDPVMAQAAPQSVDQIMKASPPGDESVAVLSGTIGGNFFTSPLSSVGGVNTLLGAMLLVFNGGIFIVAVTWGTYNLLRGVIGTAQDGEVLGKQMSTVWMPIRMVTGIVGIVPVFGGFNLAQVLFVTVTALGIGLANMMFQQAIKMTSGVSTLLSPVVVSPNVSMDYRNMAQALFVTEVCYIAKKQAEANYPAGSLTSNDLIQPMAMGATELPNNELTVIGGTLIKYGTPNDPGLCGHVALLARPTGQAGGTKWGPLPITYENPNVNYKIIEGLVRTGYASAHQQFAQTVKAEAAAWWNARVSALASQSGTLPDAPLAALNAAASNYGVEAQRAITQAAATVDGIAIAQTATRKMEQGGWMTLGSWHSMFTQSNAAVVDAVGSLKPHIKSPNLTNLPTSADSFKDSLQALSTAAEQAQQKNSSATSELSDLGSAKEDMCQALGRGNSCSFGQQLVAAAVGSSAGSGGGKLIDPIVMFKNIGDWTMTAGSAMLGGAFIMKFWGDGILKGVGKLVGIVPGAGKAAGAIATTAGEAASTMASWGVMVAATLIFVGGIMSVYIPLVPFITWMGGLVQYAVIFFEGMVAMTLSALAHMDTQGEGMGQRTEPGYVFLLNMLARPSLMVLGFFAASAACIALGTLQATMFLPALANAQGNSVTGLFSFVLLLGIFLVINWTLIQGLYNMIFLLPDNVIGMIGQAKGGELGKDTEGKVYGMMMGISRSTGGAAVRAIAPSSDAGARGGRGPAQGVASAASTGSGAGSGPASGGRTNP